MKILVWAVAHRSIRLFTSLSTYTYTPRHSYLHLTKTVCNCAISHIQFTISSKSICRSTHTHSHLTHNAYHICAIYFPLFACKLCGYCCLRLNVNVNICHKMRQSHTEYNALNEWIVLHAVFITIWAYYFVVTVSKNVGEFWRKTKGLQFTNGFQLNFVIRISYEVQMRAVDIYTFISTNQNTFVQLVVLVLRENRLGSTLGSHSLENV